MKKYLTLALILLVMGGFAQNRFTELFNEADSAFKFDTSASISEDSLYFFQSYTDSELFLMRNPFAQFLFAYEVECYNDSMYVTHWTLDNSLATEINGWVRISDYGVREYQVKGWKHKELTPSGFIKWLRENFAPEPTGFTISVGDKVFSVDLK